MALPTPEHGSWHAVNYAAKVAGGEHKSYQVYSDR